jgi:hypothetical protein
MCGRVTYRYTWSKIHAFQSPHDAACELTVALQHMRYGLRCCHRPALLASTRREQFVEQQRPLKLKRRLLDIGIS